jgi:hypothetical protein
VTRAAPLPLFPSRGKPRPAREPKLPPPREGETQKAIADLLGWAIADGWIWTASAAGAWLSFEPETAVRIGRWLREQGVRPGWPDLELVSPDGVWHGLELKRGEQGRMSDAQLELKADCERHGRHYAVARTYEQAEATLRSWGALRSSRRGPA